MSLENRIKALDQLGLFLKQFNTGSKNESLSTINQIYFNQFEELILRQKALNGWFTKENVNKAISAIADTLTQSNLNVWTSNYKIKEDSNKTIGVIMAGNIPLVGFNDMLCVLITGNRILAKLSSSDNTLIKKIGEILISIDPDFEHKISFVEKLEGFDAVIATGSNNTARYFKQYFGKYPHIIRKNRNSVAIMNDKDGEKEVNELGKDIFQYFGLGCRSVSKLFLPVGYKIDTVFEGLFDEYQNITENNKYANNYDYNKAVFLMGNNKLLDNGFLLLKEDKAMTSPVGVLFYEYYNSIDELEKYLNTHEEDIQCVVSSSNTPLETLEFGQAQCPELMDYADGVDTVKFLLEEV